MLEEASRKTFREIEPGWTSLITSSQRQLLDDWLRVAQCSGVVSIFCRLRNHQEQGSWAATANEGEVTEGGSPKTVHIDAKG